jgi:hypothetical protein
MNVVHELPTFLLGALTVAAAGCSGDTDALTNCSPTYELAVYTSDGADVEAAGVTIAGSPGPCGAAGVVFYCQADMVPFGSYEVVVSAPGYETAVIRFGIAPADDCGTTVYRETNFILHRLPPDAGADR